MLKCLISCSDYLILSFDWITLMALSRGVIVCVQLGRTRNNILYASITQLITDNVWSLHVDKTETLWWLAKSRPWVQIYPKMVVKREQIIVFPADNLSPQSSRDVITLVQCWKSSSGAFLYNINCLITLKQFLPKHGILRLCTCIIHAFSEPGIPIAHRV